MPSPTGNLDPDRPCLLCQPTSLKPGWTSLEVSLTAGTGTACTKGHRETCTTLWNSWEATKRGRGIRQHATSSMLLASSRVNTGEPGALRKQHDIGGSVNSVHQECWNSPVHTGLSLPVMAWKPRKRRGSGACREKASKDETLSYLDVSVSRIW